MNDDDDDDRDDNGVDEDDYDFCFEEESCPKRLSHSIFLKSHTN